MKVKILTGELAGTEFEVSKGAIENLRKAKKYEFSLGDSFILKSDGCIFIMGLRGSVGGDSCIGGGMTGRYFDIIDLEKIKTGVDRLIKEHESGS